MRQYKILDGSNATDQERYTIWCYHEKGRDFIGYAATVWEAERRIKEERAFDREGRER